MPSPPPTRRRNSSSISLHPSSTSASPEAVGQSSKRPIDSRNSSESSLASPSTHDLFGFSDNSNRLDGPTDSDNANGFGNLADELAGAFDVEEEEEEHGLHNGASQGLSDGAEAIRHDRFKENEHPVSIDGNQDGLAVSTASARQSISDLSLSLPKPFFRPGHLRNNSQHDGSEYGDDSDLEATHSPLLKSRLATVENLARRGTEANGSDIDEIVQRVADSLRDLRYQAQAGVENKVMRLITTHTALTTHVSHQSRTLSTLTNGLLSPLSAPPDPDFIDDLLPLLTSLVQSVPTATSRTLTSLHNLHASTLELTSLFTYLSDTLHMMRQTTSLASRRLRATQELVIEMRREAEAREMGIRWVKDGNWEGRLAGRECARLCGEVVGGFEEVCASWRERLAGGMAGVEVGAA